MRTWRPLASIPVDEHRDQLIQVQGIERVVVEQDGMPFRVGSECNGLFS
jgi:hypothetical protein